MGRTAVIAIGVNVRPGGPYRRMTNKQWDEFREGVFDAVVTTFGADSIVAHGNGQGRDTARLDAWEPTLIIMVEVPDGAHPLDIEDALADLAWEFEQDSIALVDGHTWFVGPEGKTV
jgi:hypothetical protein